MSDKPKPESPFPPTVRSNQFNPFSELKGRVNDTFSYTTDIDGESVFVIESLDMDLNGRTGSTKSINLIGNNFNGNFDTLPEEKKEIVKKALQNNSERDEAYTKRLFKLIDEAEKNGKGLEFMEALEANGNLQSIVGTESFSSEEIKTKKINDQEISDAKEGEDLLRLENYRKSVQVKNEALAYPPHLKGNKGEDYIFIEQFEYSPPQPPGTTPLVNEEGKTILDTGVRRATNIEQARGSCRLPIPNKLGVSNGVSWGEARANTVELAAFQSASGTIGNLLGDEKKNIFNVINEGRKTGGAIFSKIRKDFNNTGGSEANSASVISAVLARTALSGIGINVDVDQFITRQTGAAINPNLELLFGGPQLRTFSFNFNFAPESPEEAVAVRKIQRWFKQGMLPTRSTVTQDSTLFLGSPNVFRIQYRNRKRRIKGLNIIKICALTACEIDFTPDGTYQSYSDSGAVSMPVRSTMGLTFNELTPIFKDDYIGNSNDESLKDLGSMIEKDNAITDDDIGF